MTGLVISQTIEATIPEGVTLAEWSRRPAKRRRSLWRRLWIRFGGVA